MQWDRVAHAPSRVVSGAPAGHPAANVIHRPVKAPERGRIGEGANSNLRGRVRYPSATASSRCGRVYALVPKLSLGAFLRNEVSLRREGVLFG